jgi:ferritin-like metal-binding protein YciE
MQAMLQEAEKWASMVQDRDLRDAGLIASAQRVEHYEIAVYGSLATWAKQLGLDEDVQALLAILEEEKRTDERLSRLAKRMINPDAAT